MLLEAFHYRFHTASIEFRKIVQEELRKDGTKIEKVEAVMSFPQVFLKTDIRFKYSLGGGVAMDCGCYTVNAIRYFTGLAVQDVQSANARIVDEDPDIDGRMDAVLKLEGGIEAKLMASLTNSLWSLQRWREYLPRVAIETEGKVFTFMVFLIPSVSIDCCYTWGEYFLDLINRWTRRVFFFFASP